MKSTMAKTIGWIIVVALIAVWIGTAVMAQRGPGRPGIQGAPEGPGGPGRPGGPHPVQMMKAGNEGVFVLLGGTLAKYDATLKEQGTLKLIEPPAMDEADQRPPMPPMGGALLIAPAAGSAGEKVLVIIGNDFFSVDAASLSVAAKAKLPELAMPKPDQNTPGMGQMPMGPPPPAVLELHGRTLYVLRANQIIGINIDNGSVTGKATLPKPPAPPAEN